MVVWKLWTTDLTITFWQLEKILHTPRATLPPKWHFIFLFIFAWFFCFFSFFRSFPLFLFSFSYVLPRGCLYIVHIWPRCITYFFYHAAQGAEKLLNEACDSTDTCVDIPGTNVELTCDVIAKRCCKLLLLNFSLVRHISSKRGIKYRWILTYQDQTICIHFFFLFCKCLSPIPVTFTASYISWMSYHRPFPRQTPRMERSKMPLSKSVTY